MDQHMKINCDEGSKDIIMEDEMVKRKQSQAEEMPTEKLDIIADAAAAASKLRHHLASIKLWVAMAMLTGILLWVCGLLQAALLSRENTVSQSFFHTPLITQRKKIPRPKLSKNTMMGIRLIVEKGAKSRKGLGKFLQRMHTAIQPFLKYDRVGVGFKPNLQRKTKHVLRKRTQKRAGLTDISNERKVTVFPRITENIVSGGHIHSGKEKEMLLSPLEKFKELSINASE